MYTNVQRLHCSASPLGEQRAPPTFAPVCAGGNVDINPHSAGVGRMMVNVKGDKDDIMGGFATGGAGHTFYSESAR